MHRPALAPTFLRATSVLALACAGASAHAQSNVTLFGLIDLAVNNHQAGKAVGSGSIWRINDGTVNGLNGSRWGVRVSEDLGGGLRANALLEAGLAADTGALGQGGLAFGRQAYVGLSSPTLGEVRLGRQYILEDSTMGLSNPFGNALVNNQGTGVTNAGRGLPFWLNAPRANNVVQYQTPTFSGFYAAAQLAPGETTSDRFHGVKLGYGAGPLNAAVSYEWNRSRATGDNVNQSLTVAGNYNFGVAKLVGGFQRNDKLALGSGNGAFIGNNLLVTSDKGTFAMAETSGYTIGVEVPVGVTTFGANYSSVKYESAAGQSATLGKVAAAARYGLSKTTFLYAGFSMATGDLKEYIAEKRVVQAGVRMAW